jgi:hypothetical protein
MRDLCQASLSDFFFSMQDIETRKPELVESVETLKVVEEMNDKVHSIEETSLKGSTETQGQEGYSA